MVLPPKSGPHVMRGFLPLTELDPPCETKDELKVGHMLDRYGIPFFYQQAIHCTRQEKEAAEHKGLAARISPNVPERTRTSNLWLRRP